MASSSPLGDVRQAKLFRNNRSQAVRIPAEFEFAGTHVLIYKEGDKLVIEAAPTADLVAILKGLSPLGAEDEFADDSMQVCCR